jgi:hypothetical protein
MNTIEQLKRFWSQKLDRENPLPKRQREISIYGNGPKFIEDSFVCKPAENPQSGLSTTSTLPR